MTRELQRRASTARTAVPPVPAACSALPTYLRVVAVRIQYEYADATFAIRYFQNSLILVYI